jgi:methyl-accepting chemotaxis protein WspA
MIASLRELIGKVKKSSIRLLSTANEIAAGSRQQEAAVNEFSSSTNQITAAAKEISATSQELLGTMNDLNGVADETASLADAGHSSLSGMASTMGQLMDATGAISSRLATISEKAGNINLVVTTISKVADQTNLLSLNASIEAEKAGEYGLGFAVVAREIRRLADQTADATLDIDQMVKEMQTAVSSGVMEMDKFTDEVRRGAAEVQGVGGRLEEIIRQVRTLTTRFGEVTEGMQSQSEGAHQISDALVGFAAGVEQTAATIKDFHRAAGSLQEAVNELRQEIARFQLGRRGEDDSERVE